LAGGQEAEIVPFRERQIEQYVTAWFTNAAGYLSDPSVSATALLRELRSKPQVRGLVQNPLLLALICSLYQEQGLTLPSRRVQVYEKAVEYMLIKWSREKREPRKGEEDWAGLKQELLEDLAHQFSCENTEVFSRRDLRHKIDQYLRGGEIPSEFKNVTASDLLVELAEQDGILQKLNPESDQYLFLHRTFQEYLTAGYLARAKDGIVLAKEHVWEYDWHETISLMAGLMKQPTQLLQAIVAEQDDIFHTQLLLAGRCLAECSISSQPFVIDIIDRIYQIWESHSDWDAHFDWGFIDSVVIAIAQTHSYLLDKFLHILTQSQTVPNYVGSEQEPPNLRTALDILGKVGNSSVVSDIEAFLLSHLNDVGSRYAVSALEDIGSPDARRILMLVYNGDNYGSYPK
jgi:hypothetical protein